MAPERELQHNSRPILPVRMFPSFTYNTLPCVVYCIHTASRSLGLVDVYGKYWRADFLVDALVLSEVCDLQFCLKIQQCSLGFLSEPADAITNSAGMQFAAKTASEWLDELQQFPPHAAELKSRAGALNPLWLQLACLQIKQGLQ